MSIIINNRDFTELEDKYLEEYKKNFVKYHLEPNKLSVAIDFLNEKDEFLNIDKERIIDIMDSIIKESLIFGKKIENESPISLSYKNIIIKDIILPKLKLKFPTSDNFIQYKKRGNYKIYLTEDSYLAIYKEKDLNIDKEFIKEIFIDFQNPFDLYQEKYLFYSEYNKLIILNILNDTEIYNDFMFDEKITAIEVKNEKIIISTNSITQAITIKDNNIIYDKAYFEQIKENYSIIENVPSYKKISIEIKNSIFCNHNENLLIYENKLFPDHFFYNSDMEYNFKNIKSNNGKYLIELISIHYNIVRLDSYNQLRYYRLDKYPIILTLKESFKVKIIDIEQIIESEDNKFIEFTIKSELKSVEQEINKIAKKELLDFIKFDNYITLIFKDSIKNYKCNKDGAELVFELKGKYVNNENRDTITTDMEFHIFDDGFVIIKNNKAYGTNNWKDYVQFVEGLEIKHYSTWESYYDNAWSFQIFEEL